MVDINENFVVPAQPQQIVSGGGGSVPIRRPRVVNPIVPAPWFDIVQEFGLNSAAVKAFISSFGQAQQSSLPTIGDQTTITQLVGIFERLSLNTPAASSLGSVASVPFVFSFQNVSNLYPGPAKFYSGLSPEDERWALPVPPAEFSVSSPNSLTEITTLNGVSYTHAGPEQLEEITFDSFFPAVSAGEEVPSYVPDYIGLDAGKFIYKTPNEWVTNLLKAMRVNQPLLFSIYAVDGSGQITSDKSGIVVEPVIMSVSSFDWNMGSSIGGSRFDVSYSITLKRWRQQNMRITNFVKTPSYLWPQSGTSGGNVRRYKTRPGDTMTKISGRKGVLGDQRRARELLNYGGNEKKINKDWIKYKKQNPNSRKNRINYPITPGIILQVPRK